jgi:hypothetical protein
MHVEKIVQQLLSSSIHKTRIKTLIVLLYGLIRSKLLRLTLLGRHLDTEGTERSAILRVNRFLGNLFYQQNASQIYGAMTRYVIGNKEKSKGRHKFTRTSPKKIATDKDSKKHGKAYREPWVLVSSLEEGYNIAQKVIKKFKSRMTIEESFRDTKSVEYGFSMNENKTIKPQRYIVWLMLAALASLIAWIVGYAGEQQQLQYHFQANTYRHRRVLSFFYLGCQMIKKKIPCLIDIESIPLLAWGESTLD